MRVQNEWWESILLAGTGTSQTPIAVPASGAVNVLQDELQGNLCTQPARMLHGHPLRCKIWASRRGCFIIHQVPLVSSAGVLVSKASANRTGDRRIWHQGNREAAFSASCLLPALFPNFVLGKFPGLTANCCWIRLANIAVAWNMHLLSEVCVSVSGLLTDSTISF